LEEPELKVKRSLDHRWLSRGLAVRAVNDCMRALLSDISDHAERANEVTFSL
jgi:hypothetical protein